MNTNWSIRDPGEQERVKVTGSDPSPKAALKPGLPAGRFTFFRWLTSLILIFVLIYSSSYFALLWLPPQSGVEMGSQLSADYSEWDSISFQPLDPAIMQEIQQEQGLPEQIIISGSSWPTPTSTKVTVETQQPLPTAPPVTVAVNTLLYSPTASQPSYTSTPAPTTVSPSNLTRTPIPTQVVKPTRTRKPPKTPKPPKPPKP